MPIVARQPGPETAIGSRSGDDETTGASAPPGVLLPSGGAPAPAPALAPHRALALDALRLMRGLRSHPRDADRWSEPALVREVGLVRGQLAPIRSRRALAASFGREAGVAGQMERFGDPLTLPPLRLAYALRWLELGDGIARAEWTELVTDRA
jgi:hypothetical protein